MSHADEKNDGPEAEGPAEEPPAPAENGEAGEAPLVSEDDGPAWAPSLDLALAEAEAEIEKLKDQLLRALADVENTRRRAARDKEDAAKYAVTGFARSMLAVADNLRRALDTVEPDARAGDPALDALMSGVEMTEKELLAAFERHGITPIPAMGERFDPHVHEAMFELEDTSVPAGTVVQVLEAGYKIHDRPLRPSRVGVSRGGPKAAPAAAAEPPAEPAPGADTGTDRRGQSTYEQQADREAGGSGAKLDETL